jgi:hypothetical protein
VDRGASPHRSPVLVSRGARACKAVSAKCSRGKHFHVVARSSARSSPTFPASHSMFESARSSSRTVSGKSEARSQHVTLTSEQVHEPQEKGVAQTVPSPGFEPTVESERFVRPLSWILSFRMRSRCGHRTFRSPAPMVRACFLLNTPTPDNAYMFHHGYT